MKLAIICLTKDFNSPGNSGSYRDYLYIKNELVQSGNDVVTINSENIDTESEKTYDGIVMLNASVNFFGGILPDLLVKKWNFVAKQSCPIIYWFTDFLLPMQNIVPLIKRRFGIALPEIYPNRITLLSYAENTDLTKEWWNKNKRNIPIEKIIYYDISESCYKGLIHYEPQKMPNSSYVYIGNFRNGHRLEQIKKLSEEVDLAIYGRWPSKYVPFAAKYEGPCSETSVDHILNKYFAQYVTYDYEFLKFKPAIFRNIITINSGSLPYIDSKLDYVVNSLPEYLRETLTNLPMASRSDSERYEIVQELQSWLSKKFENQFASVIKNICLSA